MCKRERKRAKESEWKIYAFYNKNDNRVLKLSTFRFFFWCNKNMTLRGILVYFSFHFFSLFFICICKINPYVEPRQFVLAFRSYIIFVVVVVAFSSCVFVFTRSLLITFTCMNELCSNLNFLHRSKYTNREAEKKKNEK